VRRTIIATLALALGAFACSTAPGTDRAAADGPAPAPDGSDASVRLVRVVDGDTIVVDLGGQEETVRLIGIDTPESVKPDSPVECYGPEASRELARLLPPGTPLRLARDTELRDRYDRLLAYVFRLPDELFVNLELAATGHAAELAFAPNLTFADDVADAVAAARRAGLGLWSACADPDALFGNVRGQ
jgi:micrococcal nuclease